MQRRLNLAAALVHEPKLILLDEPTVGVDPQSRNHLLEAIEQLKDQLELREWGESPVVGDGVAIASPRQR